jgi:hypothetical protein
MIGTGLAPLAEPTARVARGLPICFDCCAYDMVAPYGIVRIAAQARR